jgi:hypothetical protein
MLFASRLVSNEPLPAIPLVTLKAPVIVTVVAPTFWVRMEFAMVLALVNMAMVLAVPVPTIPPPLPAQLPAVVHRVPELSGNVRVLVPVAVPVNLKLLVGVPPR